MRRLTDEESRWVEASLGMVHCVVQKRFARLPRSVSREDLFEYGVLGLMKAATDPFIRNQANAPAAAHQTIYWAILDGIREMDHAPRHWHREGKAPRLVPISTLDGALGGTADTVTRSLEIQDELDRCLEDLFYHQKQVLRLRAQGYKPREIVERLSISTSRHDYLAFTGMQLMKEHAAARDVA